jgi:hypothetical protein
MNSPHQFTTGSPSSLRPYKLDPRYELYKTELALAKLDTYESSSVT